MISYFAVFLFLPNVSFASTWRGNLLLYQLSNAAIKIGSLRIHPQFVLSDIGIDSNLYYQPQATKDFIVSGGPQIEAFYEINKKIIFSIKESPRYVYFAKTVKERTLNNYFTGSLNFLLNKIFLSAEFVLNDARERWNNEIDIRPRRKENAVGGSVLWQFTRKTSLSISLHRTRFTYENQDSSVLLQIADRLNRDASSIDGSLFYQLSNNSRANIGFEASSVHFLDPNNYNNGKLYSLYGGIDFSTLGRVRGQIRFGYKIYEPLVSGIIGYRGLIGDTNISIRILKSLMIRALYQRDIRYSIYYGNPYYTENALGIGASYYFLKKLIRLDCDYNRNVDLYPLAIETVLVTGNTAAINRQDTIITYTLGLLVRIKKSIGIGLRAGQLNRRINVYNWNVYRNFVGIYLTYDF